MKFCGNCGQELTDEIVFCGECGEKQDIESAENTKIVEKKKSKLPIIAIVLSLMVIIGCGVYLALGMMSSSHIEEVEVQEVEELIEEVLSNALKDTLEWEFDADKLKELKAIKLLGYDAVSIQQALENYDVKDWKYAEGESQEYVMATYIEDDSTYGIIFNITLKELVEAHVDGEIMEEDSMEEILNKLFDVEAEFIGKSGTYSMLDATLNIQIEDTVVKSTLWTNGYEVDLVGKIVSDTEAELRMDAPEVIRFTWLDSEKVAVDAVGGFSAESISMVRLVCHALGNTVYTLHSEELAEENVNFVASYLPIATNYVNSNDGGLPHTYSVEVTEVNDNSFVFTITEVIDGNGSFDNPKTIVKDGVAKFKEKEDYIAYYDDGEISITFDCSWEGIMRIQGYEPMNIITIEYFAPNL